MQNISKIYPNRIAVAKQFEDLVPSAKDFFRRNFPIVCKLSFIGVILLILQALFIGVADRFGVSPKLSFIFSSLFYAVAFGTSAVIGGIKTAQQTANTIKLNGSEPICKMLIIRRKGEQN